MRMRKAYRPQKWSKPVSPAREFERRKSALPPMPEAERQEAIKQIGRELGIDEATQGKVYAGY